MKMPSLSLPRTLVALFTMLGLAACGGGGGGGGGSSPTATFTIGGALSGLAAGKSVVLQNNGAGDLSLTANGAFTFATPASAYNVTVLTQPGGGTCTVTNGSGTASAAVTNIAVACKGWGTAQLIETVDLVATFPAPAVNPQVAIAPDGTAWAVWQQSTPSANGQTIWARRYTPAAGWSGATVEIGTTSQTDIAAKDPQIVVDANGNFTAVWIDTSASSGNDTLYSARVTGSSSTFSNPSPVTNESFEARSFGIAVVPGGTVFAVWESRTGTRNIIRAAVYSTATGFWGATLDVGGDPNGAANSHITPKVVSDATGNAIAVWAGNDGTRFNILASRYSASTGTWGAQALIETDDFGTASNPQVAMDASGNALAVWSQFRQGSNGSIESIYANRYVAGTGAGTGWGTPVLIESDETGDSTFPQIAMDANGNALVVWRHDGDATAAIRNDIWSNRYTASSNSWGTAALIETGNAGEAVSPKIAIDANGNALAVWSQSNGARYDIWSNRYTAGTGWGTAVPVETDNAGDAALPQVAIDVNGNALVVWQQDGDATTAIRDDIWANRFE